MHDAIEKIAVGELGLDVYPNQIEIIGTEQMLDAYSSIGMPLFYKHWSFGKHFARNEAMYRAGMQGLAYEIVINSNPCISYIMEENTATMQTLVIAHAAFGHNHFFKNNYVFKQWTDADGILDYLEFARGYIAHCEERYGEAQVERLLDAAHALMSHGVHRYPRPRAADLRSEELRAQERREHEERVFNDLWRTVPDQGRGEGRTRSIEERRRALLQLPQENILYFLEKTAPRLQPWQREILRIVRIIAQYFYPQSQTKLMNEGCATYTHYRIMNRLHEKGLLTDGNMVEFLRSHTNVVFQPDFDDPRYSGINPYALGFAMMRDIERICTEPTAEDQNWFPDIAGAGDPMAVLRDVWANYRDESFILQFLSPRLIREFGLFHVLDDVERAEPARRGDPRRARLPQDPAGAGAAVRHRVDAAGHPGGGRQPRRRPAADPASPRAQPRAAGRARRALRAAASGRSVGLRRADEGSRSRQRLGAEGARRHSARRHPAARRQLGTRPLGFRWRNTCESAKGSKQSRRHGVPRDCFTRLRLRHALRHARARQVSRQRLPLLPPDPDPELPPPEPSLFGAVRVGFVASGCVEPVGPTTLG